MRGPGSRPARRPRPLTTSTPHHLVTVAVEPTTAEQLAAELWAAGAVGIEELPDRLRAAFTDRDAAARARDRWAPGAAIDVVGGEVGLDAARDLLRVEVAGRFAVHPPWLEPPPGLLAVEIDPGHAFGSGSHVSTRLALELVGRTVRPDDRVGDLGCGTGVLAIAAALLGARVVAVDVDPSAVDATRANAVRNGVADRVDVALGSAGHLATPSDLVTSNLTIDLHEQVAPRLAPVHPRVVVAGLLGPAQLERAAHAYDATVEESITADGWMAATLRRS